MILSTPIAPSNEIKTLQVGALILEYQRNNPGNGWNQSEQLKTNVMVGLEGAVVAS
jgi:hypothetical protein